MLEALRSAAGRGEDACDIFIDLTRVFPSALRALVGLWYYGFRGGVAGTPW